MNAGHILRTMEADPAIRVVPVFQRANENNRNNPIKKRTFFPARIDSERMLDMWVGGIIMQLTSLPVCARIESWIHPKLSGIED